MVFWWIKNILGVPTLAGDSLRDVRKPVRVVLPVELRRNDRNLVIQLAVLVDRDAALAVGQGVLVKLGSFGFACELAQPLAENLLVVDVEVLVPEKEDAALGDLLWVSVMEFSLSGLQDWRTENGEVPNLGIVMEDLAQL